MNSSTSVVKTVDIIDELSYEAGYISGYSKAKSKAYDEGYQACQLDYKKRLKERKRLKIQEKRRRLYFLKQKVVGVFLLVLTIFVMKMLDGDSTIALIAVPFGLLLIFSKEMWWMDRYYFEEDERGNCR